MQGLSDLLSKGEHEQHDPSLKHTAWPEAVVMMPSSSSKWASLRISRRFFCTTCLNKKGRGGIHCIPVHLGGSLIPMHIRNEQLSSRSPYQNITSSIIYKNMAFPAWAFWENCTVPKKNTGNTVDGRNPAPVEGASFVPLFTRSLHPRRFLGSSEPSTVWINMHNCCNCCIDPIHQ